MMETDNFARFKHTESFSALLDSLGRLSLFDKTKDTFLFFVYEDVCLCLCIYVIVNVFCLFDNV